MLHLPELTVNTARHLDKIKALNGGNLAPALNNDGSDISDYFKDLRMPYTRLHDAPLECRGWRVVDFNMIFPFIHLDAEDPSNYYFAQTDEYLAHCIGLGTQVVYRLGASIEHHYPRYNTVAVPRENWQKWADVAANIIRHYNEGWGNGYHFGIRYWEIWCEPEGIWFGDIDEFNEFYCFLAKELKGHFPDLMIGGPGHVHIDANGPSGKFLACCQKNNAPLDFYSWHCYTDNLEFMKDQVFYARETVDSYGYTNAELHLNEWHYASGGWSGIPRERKAENFANMKGQDAAAFLTGCLTVWQDTPLDLANYYTTTCTAFGLFTEFGHPTKTYYAMKAFGKMLDYTDRVEVLSNDRDLYALAGQNAEGETAILGTAFHVRGGSVYVKEANGRVPARVKLYTVNFTNNLDPVDPIYRPDGSVQLTIASKPAVFFATIKWA